MFVNISCESLVAKDHSYRKINEIVNIRELTKDYEKLYSKFGRRAVPITKGFKMLLIQFMEDYSDRQMEAALKENIPVKWFCGYELSEETPDYTYFCKLRKRLGTKRIAEVFNKAVEMMEKKKLVSNTFTFVDSTTVVTKTALWKERDKAIKERMDKLNNSNVDKFSSDKDARFGCKGKKKFWFGYKKHASVDMKHGLIKKIAITPANKSDGESLKHTCPKGGMVLADKAYSSKKAQNIIKANGCHSGAILKNNMHGKNREKDKWLTKVRMPYEGIFSKSNKRARYRGTAKVQLQAIMESLSFNLKRLITLQGLGVFVVLN